MWGLWGLSFFTFFVFSRLYLEEKPFFRITALVRIISFVSGLFGGIGLFIKRLKDQDLRPYTSFTHFFTYVFTILLFSSGLLAYFLEPSLEGYRRFWERLLRFDFVKVSDGLAFHLLIFSFFLMYLPFTSSVHYLTKILGFFLIRWDNKPMRKGGRIEKLMERQLQRKISWSGPHLQQGSSWKENVFF